MIDEKVVHDDGPDLPWQGTLPSEPMLTVMSNGVASNAARASPLDRSVGIWPDDDGDVWLYGVEDDSGYEALNDYLMDCMFAPNW